MPIAASEKAALPKTDIRAVHQALDAEHRTWAREDDSPQGSVKARLEQAWPDSLADGQLIKDDEGRDQLKAMPEAKVAYRRYHPPLHSVDPDARANCCRDLVYEDHSSLSGVGAD